MPSRWLAFTFACAAARLVAAQVPPADDAAIRKLIAAFAVAENKHDAKAIAALFASDSPDREPVSKQIASEGHVWTEKSPISIHVDALRLLDPKIALVDTTSTWYQAVMHASAQHFWVLRKVGDDWKIEQYRRVFATPR